MYIAIILGIIILGIVYLLVRNNNSNKQSKRIKRFFTYYKKST